MHQEWSGKRHQGQILASAWCADSMLAIFTRPCPSILVLQFDQTIRHTRNFCCYSALVGEFRRLEHQFQFGEVDPPTENFIDLIRGKSNLLKENGPSYSHIFHSHYFLIKNIYNYRIHFLASNIMSSIFVLFCILVQNISGAICWLFLASQLLQSLVHNISIILASLYSAKTWTKEKQKQ